MKKKFDNILNMIECDSITICVVIKNVKNPNSHS